MSEHKLGATGKFPRGKLGRTDEGELALAIGYDPTGDRVFVEFGKSVTWIALDRPLAIELAKLLLKHAGATKVEISF